MASRKPPSRRPERKLDETARAIARTRDTVKTDKSEVPETKSTLGGGLARSVPPRAVNESPVYPSTKRPKKV